ncbi:uncharacterized protein [Aphelocoma coerulescens]|uniref:uncharacterized protein n=1 Tax=Aphelocoma coerulescens TaxID=39617 RepID=UPI0036050539
MMRWIEAHRCHPAAPGVTSVACGARQDCGPPRSWNPYPLRRGSGQPPPCHRSPRQAGSERLSPQPASAPDPAVTSSSSCSPPATPAAARGRAAVSRAGPASPRGPGRPLPGLRAWVGVRASGCGGVVFSSRQQPLVLSVPSAAARSRSRCCGCDAPRGAGGRRPQPGSGRGGGYPAANKVTLSKYQVCLSLALSLVYLRGLLFLTERFVHVLFRSAEAGWTGFEPQSGKRRNLHPEPNCSKKSKFGYYSSPRGKSYLLQIFDTGTSPIINKNNQTISLPSWGFKKSSSGIHEHYNLFFSPVLGYVTVYDLFSVCVSLSDFTLSCKKMQTINSTDNIHNC